MRPLLRCLYLLVLCFPLSGLALPAQVTELKIDLGHGPRTYNATQLLARRDVRSVAIPDDVAFKQLMHYRAVPLKALLDGIVRGDHLQFVASDGFAAEIPATALLNDLGSTPWLAVEDPAHPWPTLTGNKGSVGPFYLVWANPEAAGIGTEQWPYQIVSIHKLADIAQRFPVILPDSALPTASPARRGFVVFQRNCFTCHTLNGAGDAKLGPDLNIPHNPIEYMRADLLRAYIRNPQSLRHWPQARMPGFDTKALSDADLDDLLTYLRHMIDRKARYDSPR
ncbi:c-type cytochrome [Dyella tabacisoli]|uniref:Cytochrome c n=1 Tax=Dyella tabacisoli TaxID=2282381 RepID=A0A369UQC1_9GAMM|nr:cytochrome c [Dyella tabacisoli]RDD81810.1 cytochrome c [Dyella tabacisoli]